MGLSTHIQTTASHRPKSLISMLFISEEKLAESGN